MTASISLQDVTMRFGSFTALEQISLDIAAGEYAVLLGPSGCGKSTLLSVLGGFLTPTAGKVFLGGAEVTEMPAARRATTTVFQDYALFPHMSLRDNVGFGLRMRGLAKSTRQKRAEDMLALVGLPGEGGKRPHELSGGQRQRVALARALAVEPKALLLDEPLGALDLKLRRQMQDELKAIQARIGTTFIHVTHDQEEAMAIADSIIVMNQGAIEDRGVPARIYSRPATLFTAGFMGEVNLIEGIGSGDSVDTAIGCFPLPAKGPVTLAVRPEHLSVAEGVVLCEARVADSAFFGTYLRARLTAAAESLTVHLPPDSDLAVDSVIRLGVDLTKVTVFPRNESMV